MRPITAIAEDLRRIDVAFIVVDALGGFFEGYITAAIACVTAALGITLSIVGY